MQLLSQWMLLSSEWLGSSISSPLPLESKFWFLLSRKLTSLPVDVFTGFLPCNMKWKSLRLFLSLVGGIASLTKMYSIFLCRSVGCLLKMQKLFLRLALRNQKRYQALSLSSKYGIFIFLQSIMPSLQVKALVVCFVYATRSAEVLFRLFLLVSVSGYSFQAPPFPRGTG